LVISPFVRYYKGLGDNLKLYGQLSIDIGSGTTSWDGVSDLTGAEVEVDDVKYSTMGLNIAPGLQYSLGDNWSINTSIGLLGYNSRTDKDAGVNDAGEAIDVKSSSIDFGLNLNDIKIGVQYHF
jgi:opacity protein-like surface antigen